MTEQTDAAEVLSENERDRIWYALATTQCGPLHADDGWTPGEPCESCGDLANEVTPYLSRIVERIIAAREAAARAEGAQAVVEAVKTALDDTAWICDVDHDWPGREVFADRPLYIVNRAARIARTDGAGS